MDQNENTNGNYFYSEGSTAYIYIRNQGKEMKYYIWKGGLGL